MNSELQAFSGDYILLQQIERICDIYGIKTIVETGTYKGATTIALSTLAPKVYTIEVNDTYFEQAKSNLSGCENVKMILGSSPEGIMEILPELKRPLLFFLDAHWYSYNPLLDELRTIRDAQIEPVIVIHDFMVPDHPDLGYDIYDDQPYEWEWIKRLVDEIYPGGYIHWYNAEAAGARRGVVFIVPNTYVIQG